MSLPCPGYQPRHCRLGPNQGPGGCSWHELSTSIQFKERPSFVAVVLYFLLPQSDGKACLLKHIYIVADKVKGSCIETFLHGKGYELQCGSPNKKLAASGTVRRMSDSSLCFQPCSDNWQVAANRKRQNKMKKDGTFSWNMVKWIRVVLSNLAGSMRRFMTQILEFMGGNGVLKVRARIRKPRSRSRSPPYSASHTAWRPTPNILGSNYWTDASDDSSGTACACSKNTRKSMTLMYVECDTYSNTLKTKTLYLATCFLMWHAHQLCLQSTSLAVKKVVSVRGAGVLGGAWAHIYFFKYSACMLCIHMHGNER